MQLSFGGIRLTPIMRSCELHAARARPPQRKAVTGLSQWGAEPRLRALDRGLRRHGLFLRGGFHPEPADALPDLPGGGAVRTVVLAGNAGGALWQAFRASGAPLDRPEPLDRWLEGILRPAAAAAGAQLLLPNQGPPFAALTDWARRADTVFSSPIRILIHPDFGLWHAYRGVFLFAERLALPERGERANPCEACVARPCLRVCPADAFQPDGFDAWACHDHVFSASGEACRTRGCMARRACPVGREHAYPPAAQAFHTAAFVRSVRKWMDSGPYH
jgi:ferredoxin